MQASDSVYAFLKRMVTVLIVLLMMFPVIQDVTASTDSGNIDTCSAVPQPSPDGDMKIIGFPAGSIVLPMDDKQPDITSAFGFAHAILRNQSFIYRIIQPPDVTIKTNITPAGDVFSGGPILIMPSSQTIVDTVHATFPTVRLQTITESFESNMTFIVREPTNILWIDGRYGATNLLLDEMMIPYTRVDYTAFWDNVDMIWDYTLVIDDCRGFSPKMRPGSDAKIRNYTSKGNEVIYTCWALRDLTYIFPDYVGGGITGAAINRSSYVRAIPEFPGQYDGPSDIIFSEVWSEATALKPEVKIMANGSQYVDALFFRYGLGISEFFSFHPGEQTGWARRAAITLYGNKFLHVMPTDTGMSNNVMQSRTKIATKGTSNAYSEQLPLTLTVKPIGFDLTYVNKLTVNFKLYPWIDNVTNSFTTYSGTPLPPDRYTVNPDGSKSISWDVKNIYMGTNWTANFRITSNKSGMSVKINDPIESNITYIDQSGIQRSRPFIDLTVDVYDKYVIAPELLPSFIIILVAVISILFITRRKRR